MNTTRGDRSEEGKRYYAKNREKILAKQREDRRINPDKYRLGPEKSEKKKAKQKEWYQRTRLTRLQKASEWYHANKERARAARLARADRLKEWFRKYNAMPENKERANKKSREWAKKNRDKINKSLRIRRAENPCVKIAHRVRSRIRSAIKRQSGKRAFRSMEMLGCSLPEAKAHIESLFSNGMSWTDFMSGKIHLDHIRPVDSFDLTIPDQQKECFSIKNCQPLWAMDNYKKGSKIETELRQLLT